MNFKQRIILLATFIYGFLFTISLTYACEPCANILNAQESINKSDLIIIGQKVADGPHTDPRPEGFGGPDWIEVKIIKALKGNISQSQIKVNSWEGMCDYGIVVDDKPYLMLLSNSESSDGKFQFDAVNSGCAVKTFLVANDMIDFEGEKISIDEFIANFNLKNTTK